MRAAAPGEVQTVLGPVAPEALGLTLMHEHLLCDVTPPDLARKGLPRVEVTLQNVHAIRYGWVEHYGNHILDNPAEMAEEATLFAKAGGGTIVDVTIDGIAPDPRGLSAIARSSGVNVVAGVGHYIEAYSGQTIGERSAEALADEMIAAFHEGWDGVRPGIIGEIGVSDPWTAREKRVMEAAVIAQKETGFAITVHPGREADSPLRIVDFVGERGGDISRLIIGHLDRTLFTVDAVLALARTGAVMEWDFFGIESSHYPFAAIDLPNDGARLNLIRAALYAGHGDQVLMSQDICTVTRLARYGGHGYAHIPRDVVPMMARKGFSKDEIETILIKTPARLLTRAG